MESGSGTELPDERVRRALAQLGTDAASAPDVPAGVTARIGAALRAAPSPAAHAITRTRPRLGRIQIIGVILGVGAAAAAITLGALAILDNPPPKRTFPAGPTADKITVSVPRSPGDTPNTVVTRP